MYRYTDNWLKVTLEDRGNGLSTGFETLQRGEITSTTAALTSSGRLFLAYFTYPYAATFTKLGTVSGGAAGATPTLIRWGLYLVASDGGGTLVAATANQTGALAVGNTKYTYDLTTSGGLPSSYTLVPGQRYAAGMLVVTAASLPTCVAAAGHPNTVTALTPKLCAYYGGQTDLPSSFTDAALTITGTRLWIIGE